MLVGIAAGLFVVYEQQIAQILLTLQLPQHVAADRARLREPHKLRSLRLLHAPAQRKRRSSIEAVVSLRHVRARRRAPSLLVLGAHPVEHLVRELCVARNAAKKVEGGVRHRDTRQALLVGLRVISLETKASNQW